MTKKETAKRSSAGDTIDGNASKLQAYRDVIRAKKKQHTIHLEFENLSLRLHGRRKKKVVDNVSGSIEPGKLTAIMGGSGTGKTSLLNCLCGKAVA